MSPRLRRCTAALVVTAGLGLAACGGDDAAAPAPAADEGADRPTATTAAAVVTLKAATFEPADVTIEVGQTVRWKWGGGLPHDVIGDGFKSKLQSKGSFDHTFAEAGTFAYKCEVHPTTMRGTVTVEG